MNNFPLLMGSESTITRELPEDLIIEILVCLPVKSIIRFRCVSKSWLAILKSHYFTNYHLISQKRKDVLLVRRCLLDLPLQNIDDVLSFHDPYSPNLDEVCPNLSITFLKDIMFMEDRLMENVKLKSISNGLVSIFHERSVMLCNPALREFKHLPPCPPYNDFDIIGNGFFHTGNNDFKIILLETDREEFLKENVFFNVYDSTTNSWKQIDNGDKFGGMYTKAEFELSFNGVCHWGYAHHFDPRPIVLGILCFDVNTEVMGWLDYPAKSDFLWDCILVLNECLAAVWNPNSRWNRNSTEPVEIWVMNEYGVENSWTKQFIIEPFEVRSTIFAGWKNDWVLMHSTSNKEDDIDQLVSHSLHTNRLKPHQIYGKRKTFQALVYKESLISLS